MNNIYNMNMNQMNPFNNFNNNSMRLMGIARLRKEFQLCDQDDELMQIGCSFGLFDNNMYTWKVTMLGPKHTPYEGGIFTIKITFPEDYPNHGPDFKFINKIYHLNVDPINDFGHISLSSTNEWRLCGKVQAKPVFGVKQALFDIFCLFYNQGIASPYEEEMAEQYLNNREKFDKIAKEWTEKYAKLKKEYWL